ncbi:MAG: type II toxin-antitoxin system RelE/ParE family toxin [Desulfobulbaceae bacterium]|nr:type II toxin-antitoxin system RelE/ParE family toxin [Desulfobulbaceae bacterium]
MATYKLLFKKSVAKDLRQIPKHDVAAILQRIETLANNPRPNGCEKLSGQERYRIIYEIIDEELVVTLVKVGHRRAV